MKNNYLALGGLFACLHVLFLFMSRIIVGSEILLVLFLPLLSTIYTLKSDKKNIIMFLIATVLVCSIFNVTGTFIYVVPSLFCGVFYGVLRKKSFRELELLCITSVVHMFSLAFSFFVITVLFKEVKFMEIFAGIFGLQGDKLVVVTLLMLMVLGFCEAFLVHIVSDNELEKFTAKIEKNDKVPRWFAYGSLVSFCVFVLLCFLNNLYSVFPMLLFFVFFIPYIVEGIINFRYKFLTVFLVSILFLLGIFLLKYINPLNHLIIYALILSPFVINNFKDINSKAFEKINK